MAGLRVWQESLSAPRKVSTCPWRKARCSNAGVCSVAITIQHSTFTSCLPLAPQQSWNIRNWWEIFRDACSSHFYEAPSRKHSATARHQRSSAQSRPLPIYVKSCPWKTQIVRVRVSWHGAAVSAESTQSHCDVTLCCGRTAFYDLLEADSLNDVSFLHV